MSGFLKMVLKNCTPELDFTELEGLFQALKTGKQQRKEGNERKMNVQRKEKSTDFACNFYIVDFGEKKTPA